MAEPNPIEEIFNDWKARAYSEEIEPALLLGLKQDEDGHPHVTMQFSLPLQDAVTKMENVNHYLAIALHAAHELNGIVQALETIQDAQNRQN